MLKEVAKGTIRLKVKDRTPYERTAKGWKKSNKKLSEALTVIKAFKAHHNLSLLVDQKHPEFFKGQLSPDGKVQGARINVLPDGSKLDKFYSLFAKHLTLHDQQTGNHWDVLFQNPGGTYAYLYSLNKRQAATKKKYRAVEEFAKQYSKLKRNVNLALKDEQDQLALPMFTLLHTYMRIGNEVYYKTHGHKGLTTITKKDINIKGNKVTFSYVAKDGVPLNIEQEFPHLYVQRLKKRIKHLKSSSFVFSNSQGHPLPETAFKKAFKKYCGKEFYPHIVRSHFATMQTKHFLQHHTQLTKEETRRFFTGLAHQLGHRKFSKKDGTWKDSYTVTISHYIQPELVKKVQAITK